MESSVMKLTQHEATILELLKQKPGELVTTDQIQTALYGPDIRRSNTVQVFVGRLRRKVSHEIKAVRNKGYMLVAPAPAAVPIEQATGSAPV